MWRKVVGTGHRLVWSEARYDHYRVFLKKNSLRPPLCPKYIFPYIFHLRDKSEHTYSEQVEVVRQVCGVHVELCVGVDYQQPWELRENSAVEREEVVDGVVIFSPKGHL